MAAGPHRSHPSFGTMRTTPPSNLVRHIGIPTLVGLFLALASALGAEVRTNLSYAADPYGWIPVTCKLAYYAKFTSDGGALDGGFRLTLADPPRTNTAATGIDGVVMKVSTPKEFAGKTICIWLDQPAAEVKQVHYKPRVLYAGQWPTQNIGTLTFSGEVPFKRVAEPGGPANRGQPSGSETNRMPRAAGPGR